MASDDADRKLNDLIRQIEGADNKLTLYKIEQAFREIEDLKNHVAELERKAEVREHERAAADRRNLMWGVTTLGSIVVALVSYLWSNLGTIVRGLP